MRLDWSFREWGIAIALTLVAALLALGPTWRGGGSRSGQPSFPAGVSGGDRLAQAALRSGALWQSVVFGGTSPPAYVSCAGAECERALRAPLPPGVYMWMEADGASYVGRAMHASSSTVWVWRDDSREARAEPSTVAQRARRDEFLANRATPTPAETVAELIAALRGPDMEARVRATGALRVLGPAAADAVPALIENLGPALGGDDLQWLQIQASNALLAIGPRASLPALIDAFQHGDRGRAAGAALTIGQFGANAESAVSILEAALDDPGRHTAADDALTAIARDRAMRPAPHGPGVGEWLSRRLARRPEHDPKYFPLDPRLTKIQRITFEPAAANAERPAPLEGSVRNLPSAPFDGVPATRQIWSAAGRESISIVGADDSGVRHLATQASAASEPDRDGARYLLRYPIEVGVSWHDEAHPRFVRGHGVAGQSRIAGFETVTVPAGTYVDALKVVFHGVGEVVLPDATTRPVTIDATTWFAAGVGDVRYEQVDTVAGDPRSSGRFIVELLRVEEL